MTMFLVCSQKIMEKGKDLINEPTRNEKQLDHFIISDKLSCCYNNVLDNIFDHKLGIFEIPTHTIPLALDNGLSE